MQEISCENCEKKFKDYVSNKRKFCSIKCKHKSQFTEKTKSCSNCGELFAYKHKSTDKYCSKKCLSLGLSKTLVGKQPWNKEKTTPNIAGENHWNWKGGNLRGSRGWPQRKFRNAVLERDGYRCVLCGSTDKRLIADHIKPWAMHPELRTDVNNGRTLCTDCNYKETYIIKNWQVSNG